MSDSTIQTKKCTKCGMEYPATNEFFCIDKRLKCGLKTICKVCRNKQVKEWKTQHAEEVKEYNKTYHKEWYKKNQVRVKEWYKKNQVRVISKTNEYKAKNPEKVRQYKKHWRATNPDKVRSYKQKRRALKQNASGSFTEKELQQQFQRQKGKCFYCGEKLKKGWHADHVIPLDKGGSNYITNIVCACPFCNDSKGNKLLHEWKGNGGRLL